MCHHLTSYVWSPRSTPQAYNQWKAKKEAEAAAGGAGGEGGEGAAAGGSGGGAASAFSSLFAKRFYEGGFEEKMTRREAALILGVRCVRACVRACLRALLVCMPKDMAG